MQKALQGRVLVATSHVSIEHHVNNNNCRFFESTCVVTKFQWLFQLIRRTFGKNYAEGRFLFGPSGQGNSHLCPLLQGPELLISFKDPNTQRIIISSLFIY